MNGKLQVHGHCNGLKTTLLFALMWGVIMLIWWATGAMPPGYASAALLLG